MAAIANAQVEPPVAQRRLVAGRITVLLAIVLFSLALRAAVTSLTPLLSRVSGDMGFGSTIAGLFGMLPTAMFALAGFVGPALGRKIGLERLALCAAVATAAGLAGRSVVPSVAGLLGLMTVALAGMGIGNIVIPPLIKRYFADRVASMSAVYTACIQLGTIIPAALAVPIADAQGWRVSLGVWALIPVAALLPCIMITLRPHEAATADRRAGAPQAIGAVWRSPVAWGLTVMFSMTSLNTYALLTWIPQVLTSAGGSEAFGGAMVAAFSISGLVAAFVTPALFARFANPFPVVIGCAVCYLIGFAGLLWLPLTATVVWVLIVGLGPSTFPGAITLINLRCRTGAGATALSGFVQGVGYLVACAGPLVFGVLHQISGQWALSFGFLVVTVVALIVGGYQACQPRYLEDTTG
ncbi:MFS transporter [Mycobacterium montefiorense]|uniref:MFS transporter n=2 Tax=Mycobacterium montefiorense TaxID=154654 RepID=UPI0021F34918|nr:MFS transporter [Mycobacterium montefiorense]MCV7428213.1 MFS transporter [Mycobacterium montefiorense]